MKSRKSPKRGQPGNAGQFAPDQRGKQPPSVGAVPKHSDSTVESTEYDWVSVHNAKVRERAAARDLKQALPSQIIPDGEVSDSRDLAHLGRKVISSPEQYGIEQRRTVSRLVTELETAHGESVIAHAKHDPAAVNEREIETVRVTAQASSMMHADRARNALDSLGIQWSEEDTVVAEQARNYLNSVTSTATSPAQQSGIVELRNALRDYDRNRVIADDATHILG